MQIVFLSRPLLTFYNINEEYPHKKLVYPQKKINIPVPLTLWQLLFNYINHTP